eukprot:Ihof_evm21s25 gene=Ihof_evmTU21s25
MHEQMDTDEVYPRTYSRVLATFQRKKFYKHSKKRTHVSKELSIRGTSSLSPTSEASARARRGDRDKDDKQARGIRRAQSEGQYLHLGNNTDTPTVRFNTRPRAQTVACIEEYPDNNCLSNNCKEEESLEMINLKISRYAIGSTQLLSGALDSLKQADSLPPTMSMSRPNSPFHTVSDLKCLKDFKILSDELTNELSRSSDDDDNDDNEDSRKHQQKHGEIEKEWAIAETHRERMDLDQLEHDISATAKTIGKIIEPVCEVICDVGCYWLQRGFHLLFPQSLRVSALKREMNNATCYADWVQKGTELDIITGKQQWKMEFQSEFYDTGLIEKRLEDLRRARRFNDVRQMMFLLRSGLFRNLGNITNPRLYEYCHIGTKRLIEKYVDEVVYQLNQLADTDWPGVNVADLIDFFRDTRQAFGRSALLLSGGGGLGAYHIGVAKALHLNKMLPRIIAGSSAGSIVAAAICTRNNDEIYDLLMNEMELNAFSEKPDCKYPILRKIIRFFHEGVMADSKPLKNAVKNYVGDLTFQEAYNKTRRILNITINSPNQHESARLLNFLTTPHVLIWSAVCASCALPGLFKPVALLAKDKSGKMVPFGISGEQWTDGSVESDLPTARLSELFNVNHFIVSQINPHIVPFLHHNSPVSILITNFPRTAEFVMQELRHRAAQLAQIHGDLKFIKDILHQKYSGNVTIVPPIVPTDYLRIISNPDHDYIERVTLVGLQSTWPFLAMLRVRLEIELTLDLIFFKLR